MKIEKHIILAKKLKALVDRGVDGEQINAEKMLNDLLIKHNLCIEDIEGEKVETYYFNIKTKADEVLWYQIVKHVNFFLKAYGEFDAKTVKLHKLGGNYAVDCTASEYIEIEAKYDFYQKLLASEYEVFYQGFILANNLLVDNPESGNKKFSDEEIKKYLRSREMAANITQGQFHKQLTN